MKNEPTSSIDGFIPRRRYSGESPRPAAHNGLRREASESNGLTHASTDREVKGMALQPEQTEGLTRSELDAALGEIKPEDEPKKKSRKTPKTPLPKKKLIKRIIIAVLIIALLVIGFIATKTILAGLSVFKGDIFGLIQQKKLKEDAGGRTNILIFGTSEDDPNHQAAWLTDSIMVLSINQTKKDAYMVSIPRDLEVQYDACPGGIAPAYVTKINVAYGCYYEDGKAEEKGANALKKQVSTVTGLDIQYYAHVNYSVVRDVVKALGTITVDIQGSEGAEGVMDSNFDWKCKGGNEYASQATMIKNCPPNGHFIEYPNGPAKLDAEHALYLAQARGDRVPTYGLGRANFDREQNQQKIIMAIKDKALSTGTLTDVTKVSGLIDAIGKNLRTSFDTSEIRTLMSLGESISNESIQRIDLLKAEILTGDGQPAAGKLVFTGIHAYLKKKLYATDLAKEEAHVLVLNGSGVSGVAQKQADKLTELGMMTEVGNAPESSYKANVIYRIGKKAKTKTEAKLVELYGGKVQAVNAVSGVTVGEDTEYIVIIAKDATSSGE